MGGFIPEEVIEEIKGRADIVEVISDYVSLKKAGANYMGLCPFHQEKAPSFAVSQEKQLFHCFGCGIGGNVFTFLMRYEQVSFVEAARMLAQRYGVQIPDTRAQARDQRREVLRQIVALAHEFYRHQLRGGKDGEVARGYLAHRGISEEVWEAYGVGYAPPRWDALVAHLKAKGVNMREAEAIGLIIPKKGGWYDRFRGRIIFPIFDLRDRVIAFGARAIADGGEPKYLNSPDSPLFHKGGGFYGLNVARKEIQLAGGKVFIVEGYFDLLSMAQRGVRNVVATLGTALTAEQVRLAKRFGNDFYLLFDPDEAGTKAAIRAVGFFIDQDTFPTVIPLPPGEDPDAYFQKGGDIEALWAKGVPGVEFVMEQVLARYELNGVDGKAEAIKAVIPFVLKIRDGVRRELYLKRLADRTGVAEGVVRDTAARAVRGTVKGAEGAGDAGILVSAERKLVQLMIQYPHLIPAVIEGGIVSEIDSLPLRKICEAAISDFQGHSDFSLDRIAAQLADPGVCEIAFSLAFEQEELEAGMAERIMRDCLRQLKLKGLRREMEVLKKRVAEAEAKGDEALVHSLFLSIKALAPEIRRLQHGGQVGSRKGI